MRIKQPSRQGAFSLVEVVLALAVMSFSVIVLLGLLPVSLTTIKNASEETAGINILSEVVSDLKSTPLTTQISPTFQLSMPTTGQSGSQQVLYLDQAGAVMAGPNATGVRYKVTVTLSSPTLQNTITGLARISWSAQAMNPTTAVESFFALNRN